jgi:hypothetical protein
MYIRCSVFLRFWQLPVLAMNSFANLAIKATGPYLIPPAVAIRPTGNWHFYHHLCFRFVLFHHEFCYESCYKSGISSISMLRVCSESCTEFAGSFYSLRAHIASKHCKHTLRANTANKHCEETLTRLRLLCLSVSACSVHARNANLHQKTLSCSALTQSRAKFEQPRIQLHSRLLTFPGRRNCASGAPYCGNCRFFYESIMYQSKSLGIVRKGTSESPIYVLDGDNDPETGIKSYSGGDRDQTRV